MEKGNKEDGPARAILAMLQRSRAQRSRIVSAAQVLIREIVTVRNGRMQRRTQFKDLRRPKAWD